MLDIVVPVYNEGESILKLFDEIEREIKTPKKVMVVYDFEQDTTVPAVEGCKDNYSFRIDLVLNTIGRGALNAIKMGMNSATEDVVLVMMADSSDKLDVVDLMYEKMTEGYDLVCGSRYMRGGKQYGGPFLKSLFSRVAGLSLHFLTRIPTHDCTNSFKMYRTSLLNNIDMESTGGFEIGLEICVKAYVGGYKIGEVPSQWFDRQEGESNFHMWKWLPNYLHWYFYCIKNTWFK
jgi:glycosyltransferase involved in cell wall biosynthesis